MAITQLVLVGLLAVALFSAMTLATMFVRVSTINYGVVLRFGRPTSRLLDHGLHVIWPLGIETVSLLRYDTVTSNISVTVLSQDGIQVILTGSLQWQPVNIGVQDHSWVGHDGKVGRPLLLSFLENTRETIVRGLTDAVKNELGIIAGKHEADRFIDAREALDAIINSVLRLETPMHRIHPDFATGGRGWIDLYETNLYWVNQALRSDMTENSNSDIERRYGIDVKTFELSEVTYSPDTLAAKEKHRQTALRRKAADELIAQVIDHVTSLKTKGGLDDEQAHDTADVAAGLATPRIVIDNRGGGLNITNLNKLLTAEGE